MAAGLVIGMADLQQASVMIPAALLGTVAGAYLTKKIADVWFYRCVQVGLFLISLKLIYDAATAWGLTWPAL